MTACKCGEDAHLGPYCYPCAEESLGTDSCSECEAVGVHTSAVLFRNLRSWSDYLSRTEEVNGWEPGALSELVPLVWSLRGDESVCPECVVWCDECGEPWASDEDATECCGPVCEECGERWEDEAEAARCCTLLHYYSWTPDPFTFYESPTISGPRARPGVLFMGVELETEYALPHLGQWYDDAREYYERPKFTYCKSDGSLGSHGVEFVTMPATLSAFRALFPWDAMRKVNERGARSWHAGCGLHVHVARSSFTDPMHLARFVLLQTRNSEHCIALAGRNSEQWASWDDSALAERGALPDFVKGKRSGARYSAINFQPRETVELRYFRGNLRKAGLLRVVEFVAALHEYAGAVSTRDALAEDALSWAAFVKWSRSRDPRERYPVLAHYLRTNY